MFAALTLWLLCGSLSVVGLFVFCLIWLCDCYLFGLFGGLLGFLLLPC